ncbi:MAG: hypothetical protein ACI8WP_000810, partial [Flavobacteriaceae bacterium]
QASDELKSKQLITSDLTADPIIFNLFTKAELHQMYPGRDFQARGKEEILMELAEENNSEDYLIVKESYPIVQVLNVDQIDYLKMLFFGHTYGMMTEFVIRDIGNVKLENLDNHEFMPWFESEPEARAVFELYRWNRAIKQAFHVLLPEEILIICDQVAWDQLLSFKAAKKIGDKLMLHLGEYFEKSAMLEAALVYYSFTEKHPSRERRIRILEKMEDHEGAKALAAKTTSEASNASEQIFANDFLAKKGKRTNRSTTTKIKESLEITIQKPEEGRVETHAMAYFADEGYDGIHAENYLWRALFGLIFWEELFDPKHSAFHHPLQRMPSDLHSKDFYIKRGELLSKKLDSFKDRKKLLRHVLKVYEAKNGINNYLVSWHKSLLPTLNICISRLPLKGLKQVMLEMAKNLKDNSAGFPDLFIWNDSTYHFYEIKSPNDHLSSQQLFWIEFLNTQKIKAEILRIKYT